MLPAILPMHPSALSILEYRVARLSSARALAAASGDIKNIFLISDCQSLGQAGFLGARYPWESALNSSVSISWSKGPV